MEQYLHSMNILLTWFRKYRGTDVNSFELSKIEKYKRSSKFFRRLYFII